MNGVVSKEQDRHIQREVGFAGQRRRHDGEKAVEHCLTERDAERAPAKREHQALGEELCEERRGICAQRRAHSHFLLARHATGEQQVGEQGPEQAGSPGPKSV